MRALRLATVADAPLLARLQVQAWREAYAGILPQAFLDAMDVDERARKWVEYVDVPLSTTFLAHLDGAPSGFASAGLAREDAPYGYDAEVYAIYVLRAAQGHGVGRALFDACREATGGRSLIVWALERNAPARAFYERLGGRVVATKRTEVGGAPFDEVGYGWPARL